MCIADMSVCAVCLLFAGNPVYSHLSPTTAHLYLLYRNSTNFNDARARCQALNNGAGFDLATFGTRVSWAVKRCLLVPAGRHSAGAADCTSTHDPTIPPPFLYPPPTRCAPPAG
jgi:hypothetical protein